MFEEQFRFDADVIIVGAGLAGLTAAYHLISRVPNLNVIIFESKKSVGGRLCNVALVGRNGKATHYDINSSWISRDQTQLMDLLEELQIPIYNTTFEGAVIKEYNGTEICKHRMTLFSNFTLTEQMQLAHFLVKVETYCVNLTDNWDHKIINTLAKMTFQDFIDTHLSNDSLKCVVEYVVLVNCGVPPSRMSAFFYIFYCMSNTRMVDQMINEQHVYRYRMKNSRNTICEKLADRVDRNAIFLAEPVQKISYSQRVVKVTTIYDALYCRAVIIAVPPSEMLSIRFRPKLPDVVVESIFNTLSRNVTTFIATYPQEFWREEGFTGEVYVLDNQYSPGPIVIGSALSSERPALVGRLFGGKRSSEKRMIYKEAILSQLKTYFGKEALYPIDYYEKTWGEGTFYMPIWEPGNCEFVDFFLKPYGRLFWAGADTSFEWYGSLAGAVDSGIKAANQVLYELRPAAMQRNDLEAISRLRMFHKNRRRRIYGRKTMLAKMFDLWMNWKYKISGSVPAAVILLALFIVMSRKLLRSL